MPDPIPSCFRDNGSRTLEPPTSTSGSIHRNSFSSHNMVTSMYKTKIAGEHRLVAMTWSKSLMGQGLRVSLDYPVCKQVYSVDMKPWCFWKKQGYKKWEMRDKKLEMYWDLSSARYAASPEPLEGFYVAVIWDKELILLLGDMQKEALKKFHGLTSTSCDSVLISRKEHVYGKQLYTTKTQLSNSGRPHDVAIECHAGTDVEPPRLSVRVDKQIVIHVTSLMWKFRGNQSIKIDGIVIDVFWDVHNWLFNPDHGYAVFMFHSCMEDEKPWPRELRVSVDHMAKSPLKAEGVPASVLQWHVGSSANDDETSARGFSLLLYACKNE